VKLVPNKITALELLKFYGITRVFPLVDAVFSIPRFLEIPASVGKNGVAYHHGDYGGLARHTYQVMEYAIKMAVMHDLDPAVIAVAACWHDIGKLEAYTNHPEFTGVWIKDPSVVSHHITLGIKSWLRHSPEGMLRCDLRYPQDQLLSDRVIHMIASHHGLREWGSPEQPATLEAVLLHQADVQSLLHENSNPYTRK
jgi:3'-5' exoribonuclease